MFTFRHIYIIMTKRLSNKYNNLGDLKKNK